MKVGILGGTFNPIHNAHMSLGRAAKEQFGLDKLIFMPSKQPAYKSEDDIIPFEHRLNMVKIALEEEFKDESDTYVASDFEAQRNGYTYTFETLGLLKEKEPENELYFIIGADSLMAFNDWKHPEIISKLAILLVAGREGFEKSELNSKASNLRNEFGADIRFIDYNINIISSTGIRNDIENGKLWRTEIPDAVQTYIFNNSLYKKKKESDAFAPEFVNDIMMKMSRILTPFRFQHSVGVAYMAASLAMVYEIPSDKAIIAGLLHDCAKEIPKEEQERLCDEYGISLRDVERRVKQLIHGRLGAYLAGKEYGIKDNEIIQAISNHTVGRANMSRLEQIIFCADFLEPQRDYYSEPSLDYLRKLIFTDIDKATYLIIENQLDFFSKKKREVDPKTAETGEYYRSIVSSRKEDN